MQVVAANQAGMILSVVDMRMGSCPGECVERFAALGLRCCRDETDARPSMVEVVRELEAIWQMTPEVDGVPSESVAMDPSHTSGSTATSSGSRMVSGGNDQYMSSSDVSGSNLISGVMPSINPR
jgi:hypothetical protein